MRWRKRHCQLEGGLAIQKISSVAFQMALGGKVPAMTMFWLKCNAGWKESGEVIEDEKVQVLISYNKCQPKEQGA